MKTCIDMQKIVNENTFSHYVTMQKYFMYFHQQIFDFECKRCQKQPETPILYQRFLCNTLNGILLFFLSICNF